MRIYDSKKLIYEKKCVFMRYESAACVRAPGKSVPGKTNGMCGKVRPFLFGPSWKGDADDGIAWLLLRPENRCLGVFRFALLPVVLVLFIDGTIEIYRSWWMTNIRCYIRKKSQPPLNTNVCMVRLKFELKKFSDVGLYISGNRIIYISYKMSFICSKIFMASAIEKILHIEL